MRVIVAVINLQEKIICEDIYFPSMEMWITYISIIVNTSSSLILWFNLENFEMLFINIVYKYIE